MNVYFVRHGESKGNKEKKHQGGNVSLSKKGIEQSLALAERIKNINIDVVCSSPYLRAKQTAEIISKKICVPIEYWDHLRELRRPSELEGLRYDDSRASKIKKIIKKNQKKADWKYSDDESFNELLARAKIIERQIFAKAKKDYQNILCVSHIQIMMIIVLQMILQDKLRPEVFWQFYYHSKQKNTGITQLEYTEGFGWSLVTWNDVTHL